MRKFIIFTLLATTVAAPLVAQDREDRRGSRSDRSESNVSGDVRESRRSERSESRRSEQSDERRSEQSDQRRSEERAPQFSPQPDRDRPVMRERPADIGRQDRGISGGEERRGGFVRPERPAAAGDTVRNWRGRDRRPDSPSAIQDRNLGVTAPEAVADGRTIEERNGRRLGRGDGAFDRNVRTTPGFGGRRVGRIGNNVPVEGTAPPPVTSEQARRGNDNHRRWTGDWRRDGRYDWRRYRDRNRSRFHIGFYFDPFGWGYRRYGIGSRMWSSYYGQDYWLNDPWSYRLPPAYGPYRWVRYYDDALLVNIYTGSVVDVIHNFFW